MDNSIYKEERTKGLNFLHKFSRLLRKEKNDLQKILEGTVNLLSSSFEHPENVGVCITFKKHEFKTQDYEMTPWKITSQLDLYGEHTGSIEISSRIPPLHGQFAFTKEEQLVLETIAEHLSRVIEQIQEKNDLQRSKNKLSMTLDSIGDGVIVTDAAERIIRLNPQAEKLTGWSEEDALGRAFHEVFHIVNANTGEPVPDPVHNAMKTGRTQNLARDTVLIARDGKKRHITDSAAPIRDLKDRIFSVIMVFSDVTERTAAEEKARYQSFHDGLTGLHNRVYMEDEMERLDTERQLPIGIIMVDSNGLKLVNDAFGHEAGDEVLRETAEILKLSCRGEDIIARWGGDEFVILLPQTTEEEVQAICQRISVKCKETYVKEIPISLAVGFAIKNCKDLVLADVLIESEENMYKRKLEESQSVKRHVVDCLLKNLEEKSFETDDHYSVMQNAAERIGVKMELTQIELTRLELLILLHDIGEVNVSKEILNKKSPLTSDEWEIIRKHPETGYRILHATEEYAHVAEDALSHHERWDGRGYPYGLTEKEIPLLARIASVVDAYEVMRSGRPYKKAMSQEEAVSELKRCAGFQFDPELVEIFLHFQEFD